jgi:hypothetical protein
MSEVRLIACREKALGILAMVFVAGVASGVIGVRAIDRQSASYAAAEAGTAREEARVALEELAADLDLDAAQKRKVGVILDEHIMMEADLLAQIRRIQQDGRGEIAKVLKHDQRVKFEVMALPAASGQ